MSSEFDSGRRFNPSKEAVLTPQDKARRKIVDHLKDAELKSPRFQAFADYTDRQNASEAIIKPDRLFNGDMVKETIRQRINGVMGYKIEYDQVPDIIGDYWKVLEGKFPTNIMVQLSFAQGLLDIKNQEIERKSQQYFTWQK